MDEVFYELYNEERKMFIWSDGVYEFIFVFKLFRILGCCESKF